MNAPNNRSKRHRFRDMALALLALFTLLSVLAGASSCDSQSQSGGSPKSPSTGTNSGSPPGLTLSQQQAFSSATDYLQTQAFSKQGLIDQLSSSYGDGFSVRDATVAVDSLSVNWSAEAVQSAREYLQTQSFSCQGLIDQLSSAYGDKYTQAQAQQAARRVGLCGSGGNASAGGTVSQQQAVRDAMDYLQTQAFSKQGLIDQLSSSYGDRFSVRDATFAVDSLRVSWSAEAVKSAREYLQTESFSCQGLVDQLSSSYGDKYTVAEAQYAARKVGLC